MDTAADGWPIALRFVDCFAVCGPGIHEDGGALFRHVTRLFAQENLPRMLADLIGLWLAGRFVERRLGPWALVGIFLAAGGLGSWLTEQILWQLDPGREIASLFQVTMGCCCGVFGLIGAGFGVCLFEQKRLGGGRKLPLVGLPTKFFLIVYGLASTYVFGLGEGTVGHNTGLLLGLILGLGVSWILPRGEMA